MQAKISVLFFLLLFTYISQAQTDKWKYFDKSNSGLPTNMIRAVIQDKYKNYWIATWNDGLVKYDGKTWKVFNTKNSKLPNNEIYCITFDKKENLWIGTFGGGVAKVDCKKKGTVYNSKNAGLPNDWIYTIAFDKKSNVWIGTYSEGLAIFNQKKKWTVYNSFNSLLPINKVTAIYIDKDDNKIIGTADHIIFIQNNVWKTEAEVNYKTDEGAIYWIEPFTGDKVLMCYKFGSIVIYNGKTFKVFNKLVKWADVVGEGFPAGVMDKIGLDYAGLKKVKEDIIMYRTCGYGHSGPMASQPGYSG